MIADPIPTATVTLISGDQTIPAYLAQPPQPGSWPGVVVVQEVFGVNAHIQSVCQRLARAGYIAIAPHLYHRQVADFALGYGEAELALVSFVLLRSGYSRRAKSNYTCYLLS